MKPVIAVTSPIHVSTTGPVYVLSPDAVQLRHRQQRAWVSRKLQTLLLGILAMMSLAILLRPLGSFPAPARPELALSHRRGISGGRAAVATAAAAQRQQQQLQLQQRQQQQQQRSRQRQRDTPVVQQLLPDFPLHVCCMGRHCLAADKHRYAAVTYVRSEQQLAQAKALASSLWQSNPGLDLAVMLVRGELPPQLSEAVLDLNATIFYVDPVAASTAGHGWGWRKAAPSTWLKLRAFGLTQYDAVVVVEPGATFVADVAPLFRLPTDFAVLLPGAAEAATTKLESSSSTSTSSASDGSSTSSASTSPPGLGDGSRSQKQPAPVEAPAPRQFHTDVISGAQPALFLRPCAPAEAHMVALLSGSSSAAAAAGGSGGSGGSMGPAVPAGLASEAEFLAWYFAPESLDVRLPFQVYVINLEGAADRLLHFRHSYSASDLGSKAAVRWPAVDGRSLDLGQIVSPKALEEIETAQALGYRTKHYQLTRGSVGCYMSHLQLFKAVLAQGERHEHALVFEDDAVLEPGLLGRLAAARPFPPDWDVMLLGYYCWRCSPLLSDRRFIWVEGFFGTHAYLISRRAVRKIFAYPRLMPVEQQIDALMSEMAQERLLNVYALNEHPMLVDQNNKDFATSVQIPVKKGIPFFNDPYSRER